MVLFISKQGEMDRGTSVLSVIVCVMVVSMYFFPFGLHFLPETFNTKIGLAVIGLLFMAYSVLRNRELTVNRLLIPSVLLALIFSLFCLLSVDYNGTSDYSYATYIISFATWLSAAFATYWILRYFHGHVPLKRIIFYLALVCVMQCVLALLIENVSSFKTFVDTYISQSTIADEAFLTKVDRLYGIGAALDPAGTRFSIVLLIIGGMLAKEDNLERREVFFYWAAFIFISVIGNIISRTTIIGTGLGLLLYVLDSRLLKAEIVKDVLIRFGILLLLLLVGSAIAIYFYQNSPAMRESLRYGFEGFFNWVEKGEWKTSSTDLLLNAWKWPTDLQGWVIGYGLFADWVFDTDIGYCRFVLYSGLLGLVSFSIFFFYNAWACIQKFPSYNLAFLFLLALTFIIWFKVSTDLYLIYGLLFCIDGEAVRKSFLNKHQEGRKQ